MEGASETPESARAVWEQQQAEANGTPMARRDIASDLSIDRGNLGMPGFEGKKAPESQDPPRGKDKDQDPPAAEDLVNPKGQ